MTAVIRAALAGPRRIIRRPAGPPAQASTPSARLFRNQPRVQPAPIGCQECAWHVPRRLRDGVIVHVVGGETRECEDQ